MKGKIILPILLIPLAIGCTDESTQQPQSPLAIQGAGITHFLSSLPSRASESTIPIGSTLTLYSQGGIQAEALELSYNGSTWEGDFQPKWETTAPKGKSHRLLPPSLPEPVGFLLEWEVVRPAHGPKRICLPRSHHPLLPAPVCPDSFYYLPQAEPTAQPNRVHSFCLCGGYFPGIGHYHLSTYGNAALHGTE